ncbi:hypothetical protein FNJ87_08970, partial [Nonlabens mediterrranea]|nr:hypothetical protein [Nonlabens mediterrranea]
MKNLFLIISLLSLGMAMAQNPVEKFPYFEECKDLPVNQLEDCFYSE